MDARWTHDGRGDGRREAVTSGNFKSAGEIFAGTNHTSLLLEKTGEWRLPNNDPHLTTETLMRSATLMAKKNSPSSSVSSGVITTSNSFEVCLPSITPLARAAGIGRIIGATP
jgi:hypothetical protein